MKSMSNYNDLVNVEELGNKKTEFNEERGDVCFYCKDCKKIVEVERPNPTGYVFVCKECGGKNIAIGTKEGIKDAYRIK